MFVERTIFLKHNFIPLENYIVDIQHSVQSWSDCGAFVQMQFLSIHSAKIGFHVFIGCSDDIRTIEFQSVFVWQPKHDLRVGFKSLFSVLQCFVTKMRWLIWIWSSHLQIFWFFNFFFQTSVSPNHLVLLSTDILKKWVTQTPSWTCGPSVSARCWDGAAPRPTGRRPVKHVMSQSLGQVASPC